VEVLRRTGHRAGGHRAGGHRVAFGARIFRAHLALAVAY
jgi:hypothetical protein